MEAPIDMDSEDLVKLIIEECDRRKTDDIVVYDVRGASSLTDFYLLCSGNSTTQLRAIQGYIEKALHEVGIVPRSVEGTAASQWILVDYNDVLVHIFLKSTRELYNVEELLDEHRRFYPEVASEGVAAV